MEGQALFAPIGHIQLALARRALGAVAILLGTLMVLGAFWTAYEALVAAGLEGKHVPWPLGLNLLDVLSRLTGIGLSGALGENTRTLAEAGLLALALLILNGLGSAFIYLGSRGLARGRTEAL